MANSVVFTTATPMVYILGAYYPAAAGPEDVLTGTFTAYDDGYGSSSGDGIELAGESICVDGLGAFTFITAAGVDLQHILVDDGTSAWMLSDAMWVDGSVSASDGTAYSYPVCFLPGTHLATPAVERAIETLALDMPRVQFVRRAPKAIRRRLAGIAAA